ncbi:conserved hypothetical protein [Pediculus humanus corporis]|uniref:Transmembrane protein 231 n=1 Tax=Pediculus humanus subsp. corporis TaxID=121224 RepID=E0VU27_PEDHC|nr:uncharacterized protein Phum_PHUM442950 [Pediculus humanus corporis]EEB16883.1 conserved hypothetical protein [Pediculus humanus corporis]
MAVCEVYAQTVKFKYKSTICSKSTIFSILSTILSFLLPFLIAYRSHGFWMKHSVFREQPKIRFKHDYVVFIETDKPNKPILCSNLPLTQDFDRCSMIKSREEDNNHDGKFDELLLEIEVDIPSNTGVYSVQVILLFDYLLQKQCLLQMESLGVVQYNSGLPGYKLDFTGDLKIIQNNLLTTRGSHTRYNHSIFITKYDDDEEPEFNFNRVINSYAKRSVSTKLKNKYYTWSSGILLDEPFKINININYPEDTIMYKPIKEYVFSNHLFPSMKEIPWKKNY